MRRAASNLFITVGLITLVLTGTSWKQAQTAEAASEDLTRVAGQTRYETSSAISQHLFPGTNQADSVVLSTGLDFADALAGVTYAYQANASLLLVRPDFIDMSVWTELQRVLPAGRTVYLLGGPSAISTQVEQLILDRGYQTQRFAGSDRIETALAIAAAQQQIRPGQADTFWLVNGYRFPDALSVSPLAAIDDGQVLLTNATGLDSRVRDYVIANPPITNTVNIVGGSAVVSESTADELRSLGYTVNRYAGNDRYATSRAVADLYIGASATNPSVVGVVSGEKFPDALGAGVHMARLAGPLLLEPSGFANAGCLPTSDFVQDYNVRLTGGYIYGGSAVFSATDELFGEELLDGSRTLNCDSPTLAGCSIFPTNNPWNTDISAYPVHPNSANFVASINAGAQYLHPDFGSNPTYGIPITVVPQNQALVPMNFTVASESDPGPYPLPSNARVESGSDHHVLVLQQGACDLYETYDSTYVGPGWDAYSGAKFDLGSNALRPDYWTSADAAGLPILPGLVRYDEVTAGEIRHALRFTVSQTQRAFIHPATHFASSSTDPNDPPMGLRFRLKASFDTSPYSGQARVVLEALKKYGMIVADNGSDWFITGENDSRWNDTDLDQLKGVPGSAFEAVNTGPLIY